MSKPLVWISTPVRKLEDKGTITQAAFDRLAPHWREPVQALSRDLSLPWSFEVSLIGGGGVARARNRAVTDFLASKAEFLFMCDYDLMPTPQDYIRILTVMEANPRILVCGGCYTTREDQGHWVMNFPDAGGPVEGWALRVLELGTGFKCFRREAFELVRDKNPWLACENDDTRLLEYGFFSMGPVKDPIYWPGKSRWLTEDYWLDWLMRDAGITIVWDTNVCLKHWDDSGKIFPNEFPPIPVAMPLPVGVD